MSTNNLSLYCIYEQDQPLTLVLGHVAEWFADALATLAVPRVPGILGR